MSGLTTISGSGSSAGKNSMNSSIPAVARRDLTQAQEAVTPSPSAIVSLSPRAIQSLADPASTPDSEGFQMVRDRLFDGGTPRYLTGFMDMAKSSGNQMNYLTKDDISLLADVYTWAKARGTDLRYVDVIANDIAAYRADDSGKALRPNVTDKGENIYDFLPEDKKTVADIKNGDAIGSTRVDHGFLAQALDPGYSAGRGMSYEFLQKVVTKFSSSPEAADVTLGDKFSHFINPDYSKPTYVLTGAHNDLIPPPNIISENGVKYVTATGRAHGITDVDGHHQTDSTRSTPDLTSAKSAKDYLLMLTLRLLGKTL